MDKITQVQDEALAAIAAAADPEELQQVRIRYLGKKGMIQALMAEMKSLPKEEKPAFGQKVNVCKQTVTEELEKRQEELNAGALVQKMEKEKIDITLPGDSISIGTMHPLMMIQQEIEDLIRLSYNMTQ